MPGSAPVPPHVRQAVSTSTGIRTSAPRRASSNESVVCASTSGAALRHGAALARAAAEDAAEEVGEVEVGELRAAAAPPPPKPAPPIRPFAEPKVSYCCRFSGSESTS